MKELRALIDKNFDGCVTEAAKAWGISRAGLYAYLSEKKRPWHKLKYLSDKTGIPPEKLRPDLFGKKRAA